MAVESNQLSLASLSGRSAVFPWRREWLVIALLFSAKWRIAGRRRLLGAWGQLAEPVALTLAFIALRHAAFQSSSGTPSSRDAWVFFLGVALPWTWFTSASSQGMQALVRNANLIKSLRVNYAVFPIVEFLTASMRFVPTILCGAWLLIGWDIRLARFGAQLPMTLLAQALLTLGICLHLSVYQALCRDTAAAWSVITRVWFLLSPALYDWHAASHSWRSLAAYNPFVPILAGYRSVFSGSSPPAIESLAAVSLCGVFLLMTGMWRLRRAEGRLALFV